MTSPPLKGLQAIREERDLRQHELAAAINVTQSQLNKFEKGFVRLDIYRARDLAAHLGVTVEQLL